MFEGSVKVMNKHWWKRVSPQVTLLTAGMSTRSFKDVLFFHPFCTLSCKSTVSAQCKKTLPQRYNYIHCILVAHTLLFKANTFIFKLKWTCNCLSFLKKQQSLLLTVNFLDVLGQATKGTTANYLIGSMWKWNEKAKSPNWKDCKVH